MQNDLQSVPLQPLCEWLAACGINPATEPIPSKILYERKSDTANKAEMWETVLRAWMEEQHE